jgi:hypothetical protein
MKHVKTLALALIAVFAFGALAAGAAQADSAPRWTYTEGPVARYLGAGEEKTLTKASLTGDATLGSATVALDSTACSITGKIIGSAAGSPGTFTGTLHCTGVTVEAAPNCGVRSEPSTTPTGTVITTELKGTLVWLNATNTTEVGITFAPDTGSNALAHIEIFKHPGACAAAGSYTVTETLICTVSPVGTHSTQGTITCPNAAEGGPILKYWTNQTPTRTADTDNQLKFGLPKAIFTAHFVEIEIGGLSWGICSG